MEALQSLKKAVIYLNNANNKRDPSIWVFGEWFGRQCNDNACFFANYLAQHYPNIQLVWICHPTTDTSRLHDRIRVAFIGERDAVLALKSAKVAVVVQGINDFFDDGRNYLGNALKVNLWHGIMWKKLGYDLLPKLTLSIKLKAFIKNRINRHYLFVAPNDEYRRVIKRAFYLKDNEIINVGFPRNALFYSPYAIDETRKKVLEKIRSKGTKANENVRVIAYMPTFRDKTNEVFSFLSKTNDYRLNKLLEENNAIICEKSHYASIKKETSISNSRIITTNNISAMELLASADILITDYSSCFFDYLLLDRPIIHFLYDYDYYLKQDRGLYYKKEEVACGKIPMSYGQLLGAIDIYLKDPSEDHELRMQRKKQFWQYESEKTCEIIAENIFQQIGLQ